MNKKKTQGENRLEKSGDALEKINNKYIHHVILRVLTSDKEYAPIENEAASRHATSARRCLLSSGSKAFTDAKPLRKRAAAPMGSPVFLKPRRKEIIKAPHDCFLQKKSHIIFRDSPEGGWGRGDVPTLYMPSRKHNFIPIRAISNGLWLFPFQECNIL